MGGALFSFAVSCVNDTYFTFMGTMGQTCPAKLHYGGCSCFVLAYLLRALYFVCLCTLLVCPCSVLTCCWLVCAYCTCKFPGNDGYCLFFYQAVRAEGYGIPDLLDTYMKHCSDKTIGPFGGQLYPQYDEAWNPPGFYSLSLTRSLSLSLSTFEKFL